MENREKNATGLIKSLPAKKANEYRVRRLEIILNLCINKWNSVVMDLRSLVKICVETDGSVGLSR